MAGEEERKSKKSFWETVPGILTGIAALITAIAGLIVVFKPADHSGTSSTSPGSPGTPSTGTSDNNQSNSTSSTGSTTSPASERPDLFISEFSLDPPTPTEGAPVSVRIGVYNQGASTTQPIAVSWWAGENYPESACNWTVEGLVSRGGKILTCTYSGYPSWYSNLATKAVVNANQEISESDFSNNIKTLNISVNRNLSFNRDNLKVPNLRVPLNP